MEALGITLAVLVGLFFLAVVSFIVFIGVQVFKGWQRIKSGKDSLPPRFNRDWDQKPPRSYK